MDFLFESYPLRGEYVSNKPSALCRIGRTISTIRNELGEIFSQNFDQMEERIPATRYILPNLLLVRCLKRVADHATYTNESTNYIAS